MFQDSFEPLPQDLFSGRRGIPRHRFPVISQDLEDTSRILCGILISSVPTPGGLVLIMIIPVN